MSSQLEACQPVEEGAWRTKNDSDRIDPAVIKMLNRYEPIEGGTAFRTETNTAVPVSTACSWHTMWTLKNDDFRSWCSRQAICEDKEALRQYFGPTAPLLDFKKFRIPWPAWFEASVEACEQNKTSTPALLMKQFAFENEIHYDIMGAPYLLPSRAQVMEIMRPLVRDSLAEHTAPSGRRTPFMPNDDDDAKSIIELASSGSGEVRALLRAWHNNPQSVLNIDSLVKEVTIKYIRSVLGEYDLVAIFEAHRERIRPWVDEQARQKDAELPQTAGHQLALNKFALATMVSAERR